MNGKTSKYQMNINTNKNTNVALKDNGLLDLSMFWQEKQNRLRIAKPYYTLFVLPKCEALLQSEGMASTLRREITANEDYAKRECEALNWKEKTTRHLSNYKRKHEMI